MAVGLVLCAACSDSASGRYDQGLNAAKRPFGEDDRLAVEIDRGVVISIVEEGQDVAEIALRAAGPFPIISLDNGTITDRELNLVIANVHDEGIFAPQTMALAPSARRDPTCASDDARARATVLLGLLNASGGEDNTARLTLRVPACSRLQIHAQPARDTDEFRIAIVSALSGDPGALDDAIAAVRSVDADFIQFLGDVSFTDDTGDFDGFLDAVATLGTPYGLALGAGDVDAANAYIATFGAADLMNPVGHARYLMLDTADGRLFDPQFETLNTIPTSRPPGLVVTYTAPIAFGVTPGLRSVHQGARLLEALAARGFQDIVVNGGPRTEGHSFGAERVIGLSDGGASDDSELALATIRRPWSVLNPCVTSADCSGSERCDRGFCRQPCQNLEACTTGWACGGAGYCERTCDGPADCPGAAPQCTLGRCMLDPSVELDLLSY